MNQRDLQDPVVEAAAASPHRRWRSTAAFLTTAGVTAAIFPLHLLLIFMFALASQRYDTSGSGGPLKNCDSEMSCSDPNYTWMLGAAALSLLLWLVAAQVGQLVWGMRPRLARLCTLAAFSTSLTVAGCGIVYYLMAHATHAIF
jgi:hypothetical protein